MRAAGACWPDCRDGVGLDQARAAALVRASQLAQQYPATNEGVKLLAMSEMDSRPEPQFDTVVPGNPRCRRWRW